MTTALSGMNCSISSNGGETSKAPAAYVASAGLLSTGVVRAGRAATREVTAAAAKPTATSASVKRFIEPPRGNVTIAQIRHRRNAPEKRAGCSGPSWLSDHLYAVEIGGQRADLCANLFVIDGHCRQFDRCSRARDLGKAVALARSLELVPQAAGSAAIFRIGVREDGVHVAPNVGEVLRNPGLHTRGRSDAYGDRNVAGNGCEKRGLLDRFGQ